MPASGSFVQSLDRGLAVIRSFHSAAPRLTVTDVATSTGLTRATARRFLLTLTELGYVRTDGKLFWLTPRVLELGYSYLSGSSVSDVARSHLDDLARRVGESTSISVLDADEVAYIARVPARRIMAVRIAVGTRFAAHATSMGRVLLAGLPPDDLEAYLGRLDPVRYTERTLIDRRALRQAIDEARVQGWCVVDQELELGLRSVAAPISQRGRVVAAINIATSVATTPLSQLHDQLVPALVTTARIISDELDHVEAIAP